MDNIQTGGLAGTLAGGGLVAGGLRQLDKYSWATSKADKIRSQLPDEPHDERNWRAASYHDSLRSTRQNHLTTATTHARRSMLLLGGGLTVFAAGIAGMALGDGHD